ncbi:hypothetical protein CsSME_00050570 [Camellia sinensis var. sinensis]
MPLSTECSVVCEDEKQTVTVKSQLQQIDRPMYSNPPVHGAFIVSTILGDPDLKKLWLKEVKFLKDITIQNHRNKTAFEGVIEDPAQVVHAITQVPWGCHETISNVLWDWVKTPISMDKSSRCCTAWAAMNHRGHALAYKQFSFVALSVLMAEVVRITGASRGIVMLSIDFMKLSNWDEFGWEWDPVLHRGASLDLRNIYLYANKLELNRVTNSAYHGIKVSLKDFSLDGLIDKKILLKEGIHFSKVIEEIIHNIKEKKNREKNAHEAFLKCAMACTTRLKVVVTRQWQRLQTWLAKGPCCRSSFTQRANFF